MLRYFFTRIHDTPQSHCEVSVLAKSENEAVKTAERKFGVGLRLVAQGRDGMFELMKTKGLVV